MRILGSRRKAKAKGYSGSGSKSDSYGGFVNDDDGDAEFAKPFAAFDDGAFGDFNDNVFDGDGDGDGDGNDFMMSNTNLSIHTNDVGSVASSNWKDDAGSAIAATKRTATSRTRARTRSISNSRPSSRNSNASNSISNSTSNSRPSSRTRPRTRARSRTPIAQMNSNMNGNLNADNLSIASSSMDMNNMNIDMNMNNVEIRPDHEFMMNTSISRNKGNNNNNLVDTLDTTGTGMDTTIGTLTLDLDIKPQLQLHQSSSPLQNDKTVNGADIAWNTNNDNHNDTSYNDNHEQDDEDNDTSLDFSAGAPINTSTSSRQQQEQQQHHHTSGKGKEKKQHKSRKRFKLFSKTFRRKKEEDEHGHGHGHGHGHEHEYTYTSSSRWVNALMILSCIMTADAFVVSTQNQSIRSLSTHMEHHGTSSSLTMARRRSSSPNDSDNKIKYIRIQPRNVRGNRRSFELQTAVTTLSKTTIGMDGKMRTNTIDIHSQLHFGDASYFDYYNDEEAFGSNYDYTFYELIVSDALLKTKQNEGGGGGNYQFLAPLKQPTMNTSRRIYSNAYETVNHNPIAPPPSDENTANSYGLSCQLNVIDYTKDKWIHCDATREQYQNIILKSEGNDRKKGAQSQSQEIPIWALASTATAPLQEYISALYRPSTPSTSTGTASSELSRLSSTRLFSNLFLDGNSFITFLRLLLWTFSPSPEVSILLLDWSSIVDPKPKGVGFVSPVFIPVLSSLVRGNVLEARKLVFAQLLVSGQTSGGRDLNLVRRRNLVAMEKLMNALELNEDGDYSSNNRYSGSSSLSSRSALLYGAMHCQDLQSRFEKMGYTVQNVEWRTAWSVSVPSFGSASRGRGQGSSTADVPASASVGGMSWGNFASSADPKDVGIGLVIVPMYLLVGGLDWLGTVQDIANALDQSAFVDGFAIAVFYLMRHLAMYLGLSKFVVSWDGEANLFGGSSD